jgi:hypothetical protein
MLKDSLDLRQTFFNIFDIEFNYIKVRSIYINTLLDILNCSLDDLP